MSKGSNFMEESRRAFRQLQEEMAAFQEEFSHRRLEAWQREMRGMLEGWERFRREWQGSLEMMESQASQTFAEVSARGEAASFPGWGGTSGWGASSIRAALSRLTGAWWWALRPCWVTSGW